MKYFRTWKEADAVRESVTKEQARKSIEGSYKAETVEKILTTDYVKEELKKWQEEHK